MTAHFDFYMPMHEVAPSAVTMAVATDAMICTMNLNVSLFVIVYSFLFFWHGFHGFHGFFYRIGINI